MTLIVLFPQCPPHLGPGVDRMMGRAIIHISITACSRQVGLQKNSGERNI